MKILLDEKKLAVYNGECSFIDERQTQADWFIFWTLWSSNAEIVEAELPADFANNKYFYKNGNFELNADYKTPEEVEAEMKAMEEEMNK